MVPTAALATIMQTPRPPCSAPHRPALGDRRGRRRPRASRGPPRGPVACRVLGGWVSSGCAGIRRVGGPSPAPRVFPPRPFGPVPPRPPVARPSQPGSPPRGPESRGSATPRPASRRGTPRPPGAVLAPGGTTPPRPPGTVLAPGGTTPRGPPGAPAAGGRPAPGGGPGTRPGGLAPGSPPYGLLGRVSGHRGSLICSSDVSRCGLVTGT